MNLEHAGRTALTLLMLVAPMAAFAAGGWYLLVPPRSDHDLLKVLDTEPLSKWTQQGAYDSASECEAVKASLVTVEQGSYYSAQRRYGLALHEEKDPAALAEMRSWMEHYKANYEGLTASRCIKSDDPRLRK